MNKYRTRLRPWVTKTFSERLMIELALLLIPTTVLPLLLPFSHVSLVIFYVVNLAIVAIFALEYLLKLFVSESRWKYVVDYRHIIDLIVVLLAAVDFIPIIPFKGWRASPLLRLLRLLRMLTAAGRGIDRMAQPAGEAEPPAVPLIRFNISTETGVVKDAPREAVEQALAAPGEKWIDVHGLSRTDIPGLSSLFSIPAHVLETKLLQENFPGMDDFPGYSIITLWDAKCGERPANPPALQIENPSVAVVFTGNLIATLSRCPESFIDRPLVDHLELRGESYRIRTLYSILKHKIADYQAILMRLEKTEAGLEDEASATKSSGFLDRTFQLKRAIQKQGYNMSHFVRILDRLQDGGPVLQGVGENARAAFIALHTDAEDLDDLLHTIRDNTTSLIELQLNKVSFDLNRVMKILAVITCLALVPTIIAGLLGQNLRDQPYDITIQEISFFVISLMLIGLYVFYRKGWLK